MKKLIQDIEHELSRLGATDRHVGPCESICVDQSQRSAFEVRLYDDWADYVGEPELVLKALSTLEDGAGTVSVWNVCNQLEEHGWFADCVANDD